MTGALDFIVFPCDLLDFPRCTFQAGWDVSLQPKDTNAICFYFLSNYKLPMSKDWFHAMIMPIWNNHCILVILFGNLNLAHPFFTTILRTHWPFTFVLHIDKYVARMHVLQGVYKIWRYFIIRNVFHKLFRWCKRVIFLNLQRKSAT